MRRGGNDGRGVLGTGSKHGSTCPDCLCPDEPRHRRSQSERSYEGGGVVRLRKAITSLAPIYFLDNLTTQASQLRSTQCQMRFS